MSARVFMNFTEREGGYNGHVAFDATGTAGRRYVVLAATESVGRYQALMSSEAWASRPLGYFATVGAAMQACEEWEGKYQALHNAL